MNRKKGAELKSDEEIKKDGKNRDHLRKQKLLDGANIVSYWAIIIVPVLFLILGSAIFIHYLLNNDWNSIIAGGKIGGIAISGYLARYLQDHGIKKD